MRPVLWATSAAAEATIERVLRRLRPSASVLAAGKTLRNRFMLASAAPRKR